MFFKINIEIYSFLKILFIETIYNVLLIIIVYPLMKATGYEIENEIKEKNNTRLIVESVKNIIINGEQ